MTFEFSNSYPPTFRITLLSKLNLYFSNSTLFSSSLAAVKLLFKLVALPVNLVDILGTELLFISDEKCFHLTADKVSYEDRQEKTSLTPPSDVVSADTLLGM